MGLECHQLRKGKRKGHLHVDGDDIEHLPNAYNVPEVLWDWWFILFSQLNEVSTCYYSSLEMRKWRNKVIRQLVHHPQPVPGLLASNYEAILPAKGGGSWSGTLTLPKLGPHLSKKMRATEHGFTLECQGTNLSSRESVKTCSHMKPFKCNHGFRIRSATKGTRTRV